MWQRSDGDRFENQLQGFVGAVGESAIGLWNVIELSVTANDGDGQVGESSQILRHVSDACSAAVFIVREVADIMTFILNVPMFSQPRQHSFGRGV